MYIHISYLFSAFFVGKPFQTSSDESTACGDNNSARSLLAKPATLTQHTAVALPGRLPYRILLSLATPFVSFRRPPIDR